MLKYNRKDVTNMENNETNKAKQDIQNFSDMVNATEKLTKPWKVALIVTNIAWAVIVGMLIWFAYMTPVDVGQEQSIQDQTQNQTQTQNYNHGVTDGK